MIVLLATLKSRLKIDEFDLADDTFLNSLSSAVAARFQAECNRLFERSASAEYEFRADLMDVQPSRYPVESVSTFYVKSNETDGWEEVDDPDYVISESKSLIELASPLGTSRQKGRIVYTGGYVLPGGTVGAGQTALPEDLRAAAEEQVVFWYQTRNQLGRTGASGEGANVTKGTQDLLVSVLAVLRRHERFLL